MSQLYCYDQREDLVPETSSTYLVGAAMARPVASKATVKVVQKTMVRQGGKDSE